MMLEGDGENSFISHVYVRYRALDKHLKNSNDKLFKKQKVNGQLKETPFTKFFNSLFKLIDSRITELPLVYYVAVYLDPFYKKKLSQSLQDEVEKFLIENYEFPEIDEKSNQTLLQSLIESQESPIDSIKNLPFELQEYQKIHWKDKSVSNPLIF